MSSSPVSSVTLAELLAALLAILEGERLDAYRDSGGVLTIGIGHTGPDVTSSMTISHEQAIALFERDQEPLLKLVAGLPLVKAAALASFGFNCGAGALHKVLAGDDTIDNPVHTTDHTGKVLSYLVRRRRLESLLVRI